MSEIQEARERRAMTSVMDWRPIRHMTVDHIGAIVEIRMPRGVGDWDYVESFLIRSIETRATTTIQGHPLLEAVHLNADGLAPFTAYDGDEYREHKNI